MNCSNITLHKIRQIVIIQSFTCTACHCFHAIMSIVDTSCPIEPYDTVNVVSPCVYVRGVVVNGFGRGSKLLGFPTANLDPASFTADVHSLIDGVYCGWCSISGNDNNTVYKTVLSVGKNPTFNDSIHRTVECYLLHQFNSDFYGSQLNLCICAFMRPQYKYDSMVMIVVVTWRDVY